MYSAPTTTTSSAYDRPNRLKGREEGIRWGELLDKFRSVQERARRSQKNGSENDDGYVLPDDKGMNAGSNSKAFKEVRPPGPGSPLPTKDTPATAPTTAQKAKMGFGKFSRLGSGSSRSRR